MGDVLSSSLVITPEKFDHERHGQRLKGGGENRRFVVVGGALNSQNGH
jgi:hypothetical protein